DHTEGRLIAAFAFLDEAQSRYVLRGTKTLSDSDFLGPFYHTRFQSDADVARWLSANTIGWIVPDTSPAGLRFDHNRPIMRVADQIPGWTKVATFHNSDGDLIVYRVNGPSPKPPDIARLIGSIGAKKVFSTN